MQIICENLKGKVRKKDIMLLTPARVSMAAWGASILSLSAMFPHSALAFLRSSKVCSSQEPIFLWKVFTASLLHSFASAVVREARSFWDLY